MKSKILLNSVLLALVLMLAACGGIGPDDNKKNEEQQLTGFSVSGKFDAGGSDAFFTAKQATTARSLRAASSQVPLSGTLDDGDITFRLKGFYDSDSKTYTLSATSSAFKYSISGNTETETASASIAVGNGDGTFKEPEFVAITVLEVEEAEENIDTAIDEEGLPGVPEKYWGVWRAEYDGQADDNFKYIIDQWGMTSMMKQGGEWEEVSVDNFSSVDVKGDDSVDLVAGITSITIEYSTPEGAHDDFAAYLQSAAGGSYKVLDQPTAEMLIYENEEAMMEAAAWQAKNPARMYPTQPDDFWDWSFAEQDAWFDDHQDEIDAFNDYQQKYGNEAKRILVKYFASQGYTSASKIIFLYSEEYYDLFYPWEEEEYPPTITTEEVEWVKMNAKLVGGKLGITLYASQAGVDLEEATNWEGDNPPPSYGYIFKESLEDTANLNYLVADSFATLVK